MAQKDEIESVYEKEVILADRDMVEQDRYEYTESRPGGNNMTAWSTYTNMTVSGTNR